MSDPRGLPLANHTLPEVSEDDLALVQFSSGTTGMPSPWPHHRAVMAQGHVILQTMKDFPENTDTWRCVCWLPLYHDMGLIGCVVPSLMHRANLVLIRPEDFIAKPALWLRALSLQRHHLSTALSLTDSVLNGSETRTSKESTCLPGRSPSMAQKRCVPLRWMHSANALVRMASKEAITPVYGLPKPPSLCFSDFKSGFFLWNRSRRGRGFLWVPRCRDSTSRFEDRIARSCRRGARSHLGTGSLLDGRLPQSA